MTGEGKIKPSQSNAIISLISYIIKLGVITVTIIAYSVFYYEPLSSPQSPTLSGQNHVIGLR